MQLPHPYHVYHQSHIQISKPCFFYRFHNIHEFRMPVVMLLKFLHQNPAPGVVQYSPTMPHSEVTLDHALLPLPPYPAAKHPQVQLDPQVGQVIRYWFSA